VIAPILYEHNFMNTARTIASLSTCNRLRVGCVVQTVDGTISASCNHHASECDGKPGACGAMHAEARAIWLCRVSIGSPIKTIWITHSPCIDCAEFIHYECLSQVVKPMIVYGTEYRSDEGVQYLRRNRYQVEKL
jgi:deoxycytidylate deaminase